MEQCRHQDARSADARGFAHVWGATGAVGRFLLPLLRSSGMRVVAYSRQPQPATTADDLVWRQADLQRVSLTWPDATPGSLICAGPLDHFADLLERIRIPPGTRVVCLSSLSAQWKWASVNAADAALATRLQAAEQRVFARAEALGVDCCILRCGLIYGAGVDRTLTPMRRLAARWRVLPWPAGARGLRQPVHAADIAQVILHATTAERASTGIHRLPGPEAVDWIEIWQRVLRTLQPSPRVVRIPDPALKGLLMWLVRRGEPWASRLSMLQRVYEDQIADGGDWHSFSVVPRCFHPTAEDFGEGLHESKSTA